MKNEINVVKLKNMDYGIMITKEKIVDSLEVFHEFCECDLIDIITRNINGTYYNIICDEEFLLKNEPQITLIERNHREALCGNLIICAINEEEPEELGSLTPEQQADLFAYFMGQNFDYDF